MPVEIFPKQELPNLWREEVCGFCYKHEFSRVLHDIDASIVELRKTEGPEEVVCLACTEARHEDPLSLLAEFIKIAAPREDGDEQNLIWIRDEFIRLKKKAGE